MNRIRFALVVILQSAGLLLAQSFEVATVKPVQPGSSAGFVRFQPGGRLHAPGVTLQALILEAYPTAFNQIAGGPSWIASDRYDVEAIAGKDASKDEMRSMLQ